MRIIVLLAVFGAFGIGCGSTFTKARGGDVHIGENAQVGNVHAGDVSTGMSTGGNPKTSVDAKAELQQPAVK